MPENTAKEIKGNCKGSNNRHSKALSEVIRQACVHTVLQVELAQAPGACLTAALLQSTCSTSYLLV